MDLDTIRCQCGKIIFQQDGDSIVIKCRHCKRYLVIKTRGIVSLEYRDMTPEEERSARPPEPSPARQAKLSAGLR